MIYIPEKNAEGKRRYGVRAGHIDGEPENLVRCIAEVQHPSSWIASQCSHYRGFGPKGLYCRQHAKYAPRKGID